jgi:2-polyprenyl-3-methyl-5-hydroxy-6-metoxy-1,4-benzoquinol methylase
MNFHRLLNHFSKQADSTQPRDRPIYSDPGPRMIKSLDMRVHVLGADDIGEEVGRVRTKLREKFGDGPDARLTPSDWARYGFTLDKIRNAKSVLDIGVAHGVFINSVAAAGFAEKAAGIDIKMSSFYTQSFPGFERITADVSEMPFQDGEFDTVTCMEVIEHLTGDKLSRAIAELRRVASKHLIISVPFCEPLPLPAYHHQQFMPERVLDLFPNATFTLLLKTPVHRVPWLVIEEWY